MATATTTKATRKNHFYVACLGYGVGVTDSNGEPRVRVLVFDTKRQAHDYVTSYDGLNAHRYAEEVGARGAKALMRKQLVKKVHETFSDADDIAYMSRKFRRMGAAELIKSYREYVFC